jgi:hypothetical protein
MFMKFWQKVEAAFKRLFGSTSWEKTASAVITYCGPLLTELVQLSAGGPAAALVQGLQNTLQSDLATVSAVVTGATSTPSGSALQTALNALNSIKANLSGLLTAADVKNSTNAATITGIADTLLGEVEAILENAPSLTAAAPAVKAAAAPAK